MRFDNFIVYFLALGFFFFRSTTDNKQSDIKCLRSYVSYIACSFKLTDSNQSSASSTYSSLLS